MVLYEKSNKGSRVYFMKLREDSELIVFQIPQIVEHQSLKDHGGKKGVVPIQNGKRKHRKKLVLGETLHSGWSGLFSNNLFSSV